MSTRSLSALRVVAESFKPMGREATLASSDVSDEMHECIEDDARRWPTDCLTAILLNFRGKRRVGPDELAALAVFADPVDGEYAAMHHDVNCGGQQAPGGANLI